LEAQVLESLTNHEENNGAYIVHGKRYLETLDEIQEMRKREKESRSKKV